MKLKNIIAVSMVLLLCAVSVMTTGCKTTPSDPGAGGTNVVTGPVIDQQTLNDAAIILRNAARNAAAIAIQEKPENRKYVELAVTTLDTFLIGNNYTPGALVKAMEPLLKEVKDVKYALAINTVTDLYEVFFGRYVKAKIGAAADGNALLFLTNLREGASSALELTAPPAQ